MIAAAATIKRWRDAPQLMVRELFGATPEAWQDDALASKEPRLAMKASKGPGKTTVLSWRAWNFLLCYPHPNIAATSVSAANLRDNLFKEMAVWRNKAPLLQENFEQQVERIFNRASPETWFMSARSWAKSASPEAVGNTLAGLHSDYIMFLIDESGSIPTAITMSAEAALASCKVGYVIQAGNTNSLDGALYDACVTRRHLWRVIPITGDPDDPKRSTRVSLAWAREMIATYGRENPFVKVMVLGEWPSASVNALLGPEDIQAAQKRQYQQHDIDHAAKILGVDVGLFGDDPSVIFPRQGLVAFAPKKLLGATGFMGASQIARSRETWTPDAIFVDCTGGYGQAWIEAMDALKITAIPVGFAEKAAKSGFYNRRAEMHWDAAEWVKNGGCLPDDPELIAEATQTTYTYRGDKMLLEPKDMVKAKIGRSPNKWDAFVLTFAAPVAGPAQIAMPRRRETEYDPFAAMLRAG